MKLAESKDPTVRRGNWRLLSLDPGTDHYGFAALKFRNQAVAVVRCGMFSETMKELKDDQVLHDDVRAYLARFEWLLRKSRANHVGAERYVPRRQGISNESVNMMLGNTVGYAASTGVRTSLFLAATWKLRLKRVLDLDDMYVRCKPVPDHAVDAVLIGLFTAEKLGHYKIDKLTKQRQATLCNDIKRRFIDLRTAKKGVKRRATTRKRRRR